MEVSFYPYKAIGDRPNADKPIWAWNTILLDETRKAEENGSPDYHIAGFTHVDAFHELPLSKFLTKFEKGHLLEVELLPDDKMRALVDKPTTTPVWVVECVHQLGYYVLVRWLGAKASDGAFWVHTASASVHQVGWLEQHRVAGAVLATPFHIFDNMATEAWPGYLRDRVTDKKTPSNEFSHRSREININKFRVNERVETIHDVKSSVLAPAIVKKIVGRRVLLEYSKADIDKPERRNKDNMWKDMDDDLIYPVGFAAKMGLRMTANKKYRAHVDDIAKAIKAGEDSEDTIPYARTDATQEKVYHWHRNASTHEWKVDMVCEMIDREDASQNIFKAARVIKVLPDGYLQLGPEGPDIVEDSLYLHQSSTVLFPVGYAKAHELPLHGPKGDNEDVFNWDTFLSGKSYERAPDHFFHAAAESDVLFKVGERLEAIDQNEKMLCPATVKAIKGRLVLVSFDGWEEEFDQLYDYRSTELIPCGWGEMVGHPLQKPEKPADSDSEEESDEAMEE